MRATKIPPGAGNRRASLVSGRYRRARFRSAESFSFQQTDGPITSVVRASGSEGPFGRRPNMEHRGVEYLIIQGIKRGFWKWSVETETEKNSGTSDSRDAAMTAAKRAIDNALDPKKRKAYSAGMKSRVSRRPTYQHRDRRWREAVPIASHCRSQSVGAVERLITPTMGAMSALPSTSGIRDRPW